MGKFMLAGPTPSLGSKPCLLYTSLQGKRVLLVDLDAQQNLTFTLTQNEDPETSIYDAVSYTHLDVYKRQILDHVERQRLALGEQPYLAKNDPFTPLDAGEEVPFQNAAIVQTRSGDYAIRASYDGVELG